MTENGLPGEPLCDADEGRCEREAVSYCTGCECWRCPFHECECGTK